MRNKLAILLALLLAIISCSKNPTAIENSTTFDIVVKTEKEGTFIPVAGVTVFGGSDYWNYFSVTTDQNGIAKIPISARYGTALMCKDNFLPGKIEHLDTVAYYMAKTEDSLQVLGTIKGAAIKMTSDKIITIDGYGIYRVYSYSNSEVMLETCITLNDSFNTLIKYKVYGETLWVSSDFQGLFAYSIAKEYSPAFINKIAYTDIILAFAVKDSLVAYKQDFQLSIVSLGSSGQVQLLSQLGNVSVRDIEIIGNYLYLLGGFSWPKIYDISNPASPVLLNDFMEPECWGGFFHEDKLFLGPLSFDVVDDINPATYKVKDISTPSTPVDYSVFGAGGIICGILNDTLAYGHSNIVSDNGFIFKGTPDHGYSVVASLSSSMSQSMDNMYTLKGFLSWPYLVLGSKVCQYIPR